MTATLVAVMPPKDAVEDAAAAVIDVPDAREVPRARSRPGVVRQAREAGVALTGPGGLLKAMTNTVIDTALDEEMSEHLGYNRHTVEGRGSGNSRNGFRCKTVLTDAWGSIEIEVPRDREVSPS